MIQVLEDARKLAHGTYADVIVVEHRKQPESITGTSADGPSRATPSVHVVLEMPEGSRVIDTAHRYDIDGVVGEDAPRVGASYRLVVAPASMQAATLANPGTSLRYETMNR